MPRDPSAHLALPQASATTSNQRHRPLLLGIAVALAAVVLSVTTGGSPIAAAAASSDHLMCGWRVAQRPQTVSVDADLSADGVSASDVIAAFTPWNALYEEYYGFPIFVPFSGNPTDADIVVSGHGGSRTWVQGRCDSSYRPAGNNSTTVFLGTDDAWRNLQMLPHELGHALGFADHGDAAEMASGHIGPKPCGSYIGVMSYDSSPQSWFLDLNVAALYSDGNLVRDYWN